MATSDGDRLYVAVYEKEGGPEAARYEEDYHWVILLSPRLELESTSSLQFYAKEDQGTAPTAWQLVEEDVCAFQTAAPRMLARVWVATVMDKARIEATLRSVPVPWAGLGGTTDCTKPSWMCLIWVHMALKVLHRVYEGDQRDNQKDSQTDDQTDQNGGSRSGGGQNNPMPRALGRAVLNWWHVRDVAMDFIKQKTKAHRYDGKDNGKFNPNVVPTYDLLMDREFIP